jgi:peroxiredoxin
VQIIGISYAGVDTLQDWAMDEGFEYELWQDTERALAVHYGAASTTSSAVPGRVTVVLDGEGNQILSYDVGFSFGTHPAEVLEDCEAIWGD